MRISVLSCFLFVCVPVLAAAQTLVVTHVSGEVTYADTQIEVGDRLSPHYRLEFGDPRAFLVVVSTTGQSVIRADPRTRRRLRATMLFVRDLMAPIRDIVNASTRSVGLGTSFRDPSVVRRAMPDGDWLLLGPQSVMLQFAQDGDTVWLRYESEGRVAERELPLEGTELRLDRSDIGFVCADGSDEPPLAWLVYVPRDGPEQQLTGYLNFRCPDQRHVRESLSMLFAELENEPEKRIFAAEDFLRVAYGRTDSAALKAWLEE